MKKKITPIIIRMRMKVIDRQIIKIIIADKRAAVDRRISKLKVFSII